MKEDKMELTRNELIVLRGALSWKRMYKGMKHAPHGVIIWEDDWMQDSLDKINAYIKEHYPDVPDWK
tara:strand:+ start:4712 stop:4912 length:201 start_codon:yes stop_codon:yes gene_type:complete